MLGYAGYDSEEEAAPGNVVHWAGNEGNSRHWQMQIEGKIWCCITRKFLPDVIIPLIQESKQLVEFDAIISELALWHTLCMTNLFYARRRCRSGLWKRGFCAGFLSICLLSFQPPSCWTGCLDDPRRTFFCSNLWEAYFVPCWMGGHFCRRVVHLADVEPPEKSQRPVLDIFGPGDLHWFGQNIGKPTVALPTSWCEISERLKRFHSDCVKALPGELA